MLWNPVRFGSCQIINHFLVSVVGVQYIPLSCQKVTILQCITHLDFLLPREMLTFCSNLSLAISHRKVNIVFTSRLCFLCFNFDRVVAHKDKNRMLPQNLAIVFGPTLMWPKKESFNVALSMVFQNQCIEFIINEHHNLWK